MKSITGARAKRFIKEALARVRGDWLIFGGAVLPLLGDEEARPTLDIDVAALGWDAPQSAQLKWMDTAEALGLAPEAINTAGAFFVGKLKLTETDCALLAEGKGVRLFRPGPTAYLSLKLGRLSENDLVDCMRWIDRCRRENETIDLKEVRKAMAALRARHRDDHELQKRLRRLEQEMK